MKKIIGFLYDYSLAIYYIIIFTTIAYSAFVNNNINVEHAAVIISIIYSLLSIVDLLLNRLSQIRYYFMLGVTNLYFLNNLLFGIYNRQFRLLIVIGLILNICALRFIRNSTANFKFLCFSYLLFNIVYFFHYKCWLW